MTTSPPIPLPALDVSWVAQVPKDQLQSVIDAFDLLLENRADEVSEWLAAQRRAAENGDRAALSEAVGLYRSAQKDLATAEQLLTVATFYANR